MLGENTEDQDCNDQSLMESTNSIHHLTLADSLLNCPVCDESLTDGDEILCHFQRPAETTGYVIAQIRCLAHGDDIESLLTLGTDEILVAGRIGRCSDQATQQSWPILLAPDLQVISSAATATAQRVLATHTDDTNITKQQSSGSKQQTIAVDTHKESRDDGSTNIVGGITPQKTSLNRWEETQTIGGSQ